MQKNSAPSRTKILFVAMLVVLFGLAMLTVSVFQIVKINKLNNQIAKQEREIEELTDLYNQLLNNNAE